MYQSLTGNHPKVPWRRILCNNHSTPKSQFILWLALWRRLPTLDRLIKWKAVDSDICVLCNSNIESAEHLFFECPTSSLVWQKILSLLQLSRPTGGFTYEIQWMLKSSTGGKHQLLMIFFAESIYSIWLNRNDRIFNQHCKPPTELFKEIQFRVAAKAV
ncbi:uncharacterized protein [Spinacia oleracea]|uniref:Reverse transcriptase zinc-binding domain-containing protein n=1 Tax=Spinacia oleracea TaxID=3562 RepID=A0A9R0JJ89_SPIOL|nr:uncharacterized protein LOC110776506 [Spinacia oleracea]